MRLKTTYICEICGFEYPKQWMAELCEKSPPLEPLNLQIGEKVYAYERYGKPKKDEVVSIKLQSDPYCWSLLSWNDYDTEKEFVENKYTKNVKQFHGWSITVKHYHQLGKDDDTYSNILDPSNIWKMDGKNLAYPDKEEYSIGGEFVNKG